MNLQPPILTPELRPLTPRSSWWIWLACLMLALAGGCASKAGRITPAPDSTQALYTQEFQQAFVSSPAEGEYNIVMLDDGMQGASAGKGPLTPVAAAPLRQAMHIHLYWRPLPGYTQGNPAADNAVIQW